MPSCAAIAPIAQHRGGDAQLASDLDQRPTAARQQGNRLPLELIRKMTPFLAHSTPFRSRRSLAKVSTNAGEAQLSCPVPMPSSVATSDSPLPPSSSRFTACALNSLVKLRRVRLSAILPSWGAWFVSKRRSPRGEVQPSMPPFPHFPRNGHPQSGRV